MLANLLSSQQRSAAQSRKHLVQRAMPFANLHKEGSSGNAAIESFSAKDGPRYSSSNTQNAAKRQLNGVDKSTAPAGCEPATVMPQERDRIKESAPSLREDNSLTKRVSFIAQGESKVDVKVITSPTAKPIPHDAAKQKSALKKRPINTTFKSSTDVAKIDCHRDDNAKASTHNNLKRKRDHIKNAEEMSLDQKVESSVSLDFEAKYKKSNDTTTANESKSLNKVIETIGSPPKKKKKEFSPFRVKVGCVVAVRFKKIADGGNAAILPVLKKGDLFCPVISPVNEANEYATPAEDEVAVNNKGNDTEPDLISGVQPQTDNPNANDEKKLPSKPKKPKPRKPKLIEVWTSPIAGHDSGIALLGRRIRCFFPKSYLVKWQRSHEDTCEGSLKRIVEGNVVSILDDRGYGTSVGLLIDRSLLKLRPYLQTISDETNDAQLSSSEQKRRNLEALIRGKDKVIVEVILSTVYESRSKSIETGAVAQWVVAKHVLTKPSGLKPTKSERKEKGFNSQSLFVGDHNDTFTQQEENWRWSAGRMVQPHYDGTDLGNSSSIAASQLLGEVVKMDVGTASQDGSASLATVTIRRLLAPHQTKRGRMPHHRELELFDITSDSESGMHFQAPVEDLVVIGRRVERHPNEIQDETTNNWCFNITNSYDPHKDIYTPLASNKEISEDKDHSTLSICQNCKRLSSSQKHACNNHNCNEMWCQICLQHKNASLPLKEENWIGPCCSSQLTTGDICTENNSSTSMIDESTIPNSILSCLVTSMRSANHCSFKLPTAVEFGHSRPSFNPCGAVRKGKFNQKKKRKLQAEAKKTQSPRKKLKHGSTKSKLTSIPSEDYNVFKPTFCRSIPFEEVKQMPSYLSNNHALLNEDGGCRITRNAPARKVVVRKVEEKSNSSDRAARASQRRMLKSLTGLGDSVKAIDRLSGRDREEQLRFGRSLIHGWGVFATEPINAGDMIIEYRGELIGNAVADKREIEYERLVYNINCKNIIISVLILTSNSLS